MQSSGELHFETHFSQPPRRAAELEHLHIHEIKLSIANHSLLPLPVINSHARKCETHATIRADEDPFIFSSMVAISTSLRGGKLVCSTKHGNART
jgi:hypothetical protein